VSSLASTYCGSVLLSVRTEPCNPTDKKKREVAYKVPMIPLASLALPTKPYILRALVLLGDELPTSCGDLGVAVKVCSAARSYLRCAHITKAALTLAPLPPPDRSSEALPRSRP
jgi:hypothetical protein